MARQPSGGCGVRQVGGLVCLVLAALMTVAPAAAQPPPSETATPAPAAETDKDIFDVLHDIFHPDSPPSLAVGVESDSTTVSHRSSGRIRRTAMDTPDTA